MKESTTARRRHAEQRRLQLIDTALAVFATKGVDGATIKDLSEAAGVAQGLLYHYFRSKDELLEAALDRHYFLPELRRITSLDRDRPVAEVLLEVVTGFDRLLREKRQFVQVVFREAMSNPMVAERLERGRREGVRLLTEYLDSRVAAGELRPHDTETTARLLAYAVATANLIGTPTDTFLPAVVETVLHGIAVNT
jgi:TetR/AcrR family transcriptional regulator, cholesterol catabolism regulator